MAVVEPSSDDYSTAGYTCASLIEYNDCNEAACPNPVFSEEMLKTKNLSVLWMNSEYYGSCFTFPACANTCFSDNDLSGAEELFDSDGYFVDCSIVSAVTACVQSGCEDAADLEAAMWPLSVVEFYAGCAPMACTEDCQVEVLGYVLEPGVDPDTPPTCQDAMDFATCLDDSVACKWAYAAEAKSIFTHQSLELFFGLDASCETIYTPDQVTDDEWYLDDYYGYDGKCPM